MNNDIWEKSVSVAGEEISRKHETESRAYKIIGEIALAIINTYGVKALTDFAEDVKSTHGVGYSPHTYRSYANIVKAFKNIDVPDDFPVHALTHIASTDDPEMWVNKAVNEGLTGYQIVRLIKEEKGTLKEKEKKVKTMKCPHCKKRITIG